MNAYRPLRVWTLMALFTLVALVGHAQTSTPVQAASPAVKSLSKQSLRLVDGPVSIAQSAPSVRRAVSLPSVALYAEVDHSSDGTSQTSGMVVLRKTGAGTALLINLWGLGDTLSVTFNEQAATLSIAPQQIYSNASYGAIWACSADLASGHYSTTTPIMGTLNADGSITLGSWVVVAPQSSAVFGAFTSTDFKPCNATMTETVYNASTQRDSLMTYPVYVSQTHDNQVQVANWGGYGQSLNVLLNSDQSIEVPSQMVVTMGSYGEFVSQPVTINAQGVRKGSGNLRGTGTATAFTLPSWGLFLSGGNSYVRVDRGATITFPQGTVTYPATIAQDWSGTGTEADPYVIATARQWLALAQSVNSGNDYRGKFITLGADISLSGLTSVYRPVGVYSDRPFNGTLDGAGHRISGLELTQTEDYAGLLGCCDSLSEVKNLVVDSITIGSIGSYCGGVAGYSKGRMSHLTVQNASISHFNVYGGGVVGQYDGPLMEHVSFSGTLNSYGRGGGIVGVLTGTLRHAQSHGTITMPNIVSQTQRGLGGVVGTMSPRGEHRALIEFCYNDAQLTDRSTHGNVGGVVGEAFSGTARYCFNAGPINSQARIYNSASLSDGAVGGVAATSWGGTLSNCYNSGTIVNTQASNKVGGIMGYARFPLVTISQEGRSYSWLTTVTGCYNSAQVVMPTPVATQGVYGTTYADSVFINCYADQQTAGALMPDSVARLGATTALLTSGQPLPGMSAEHWTYAAGLYPRLLGLDTAAAALLSAAPLRLAPDETVNKVKHDFTVSSAGGVQWALYGNGGFVTETAGLKMNGDTVTLKNAGSSEYVVARREGTTFKTYYLHTVDPSGFAGTGTPTDPYLIQTKEDLIALNTAVTRTGQRFEGDHFLQTADIDLGGDTQFAGIGTDGNRNHAFAGTYNGGGHAIHRMVIDALALNANGTENRASSRTVVGFFGYLAASGTVSDLTIAADCQIRGYGSVGAIAGRNQGTIERCRNLATVTASYQYAGGITGYNEAGATVSECYNAGTITTGFRDAAGIASYNQGTVRYCHNAGTVRGDSVTASHAVSTMRGAAGVVNYNYSGGVLEGNINAGTVSITTDAGGIVSGAASATCTMTRNINYGTVLYTALDQATRGSFAGNAPLGAATVSGNLYDAQLTPYGAAACAELAGVEAVPTATLVSGTAPAGADTAHTHWARGQYPVIARYKHEAAASALRRMVVTLSTGETADDQRTPATLAQADSLQWTLQQGRYFNISGNTLSFSTTGAATSVRDTLVATLGNVIRPIALRTMPRLFAGQGTAQDPFQIRTKDDMLLLSRLTNDEAYAFNGYCFKVMSDIDFATTPYVTVASGNNLFNAEFDGGGHQFLNINFGGDDAGEFLGLFGNVGSGGHIHHVVLRSGTLTSSRYGGGIAGKLWGRIDHCENHATVTTNRYLGAAGIVADMLSGSRVSHCANYGPVLANGSFNAGIACLVEAGAVVDSCANHAALGGSGRQGVAGIASNVTGTVANCWNTGNITGGTLIAGIVQTLNQGSRVLNCSNSGAITGTSNNVGGIVATTGADHATATLLQGCANSGSVTGANFVGGIAGRSYGGVSYLDCTNSGSIHSSGNTGYAGGIAGGVSGKSTTTQGVTRCLNSGLLVGTGYVGGIAGTVGSNVALTDCHNEADILASEHRVGGIAGDLGGDNTLTRCWNIGNIETDGHQAGGIAGAAFNSPLIDQCFNLGNVTAGGNTSGMGNAGGLVAYGEARFADCYNQGTVTANSGRAGGLMGASRSGTSLRRCYNAGTLVTGDSTTTGNLVGVDLTQGSLTLDSACYDTWVNPALASATDAQGTALTTRSLTMAALGEAFALQPGMYPVLTAFAGDSLVCWFAATPVLDERDTYDHVAHQFTIGTPAGTRWTCSGNLAIDGNQVATKALGEAWIAKQFGSHFKTWTMTVTALSGVTAVEADAHLVRSEYFSLNGISLGTLRPQTPGIYVVRDAYSNGTTRARKLQVR